MGETITQDAHCMSNMGRRPNKCQLPASPFITTFQLKPCTTGVRATHWKSSAGALVSEGNPCPGACRKAEERGCGQRAAVSAGATDTAAPPGTSRRVPGLGSVDSPSRSDRTFRLSETAAAPVPGGCLVCHAKPHSEHSPEAKTLL